MYIYVIDIYTQAGGIIQGELYINPSTFHIHTISYLFFRNAAARPRKASGKHKIAFENDTTARRRKRNERKKHLFITAYELATIAGGSIIVPYTDLNNRTWVYCNNDSLYEEYTTVGLKPTGTDHVRCDDSGTTTCAHLSHFNTPSSTPAT